MRRKCYKSVTKFLVRSGCVCAKSVAYVFATTIFGKGDKFQLLLEAAAQEAHESVRLTVELMNPRGGPHLLDHEAQKIR